MDRRSFVKSAALAYAAMSTGTTAAASELAQIKMPVANTEAAKPRKVPYKRIETEGAWGPLEMFEMYTKLLDKNPFAHPGLASMWGSAGQRSGEGEGTASPIVRRLADMGAGRISDMDASGVDLALTFLTAPGVQVFDAPTANSLASSTNDQLAEAIRKHPTRFAGLAAIAPQDPKAAAKEMERATKTLGLKGAVVNSHTEGEYLDDPKFWDIFEAAEALNVPIYIHPREPGPQMLQPYLRRGMERALWGFNVEVSLHTLALITAGVFDRFPNLKIVIGHGGEGIPYMLYRIDYWETRKKPFMPKLKMLPSDYMRRNIYITTSGLPWGPAIQFAQSVLGVDRVMYAMDYPYEFVIEEVTMTDDIPMSDMDKKKLFQTNAENVFSL
ncbi:MAG TPA: amidohydrolase family protein [Candidatus Dormibacteraeota bacterium]|nr:amidohydrolase family protein [Candidatus Dormibacteraeota bacterium]